MDRWLTVVDNKLGSEMFHDATQMTFASDLLVWTCKAVVMRGHKKQQLYVEKVRFLKLKRIVTTRKRSMRRLCFRRCLSVHRGVSVQGVLCLGFFCPGRSLSRGVFVQGVFVQGGLCPGGSLSRGVSVQGQVLCLWGGRVSVQRGSLPRGESLSGGLSQGDPPYGYLWAVRNLLK